MRGGDTVRKSQDPKESDFKKAEASISAKHCREINQSD